MRMEACKAGDTGSCSPDSAWSPRDLSRGGHRVSHTAAHDAERRAVVVQRDDDRVRMVHRDRQRETSGCRVNAVSAAPPYTRDEIIEAFLRQEEESLAFWNAFDRDAFFQPVGASWSPADTVRHLIKSTRPVVRALGLPKLVLRVMFGKPRRPSVPYDELRMRYLNALAEGGQAGSYAPNPRTDTTAAAWRDEIMHDFAAVNRNLRTSIGRWTDNALDTVQLPHPFAGKFTVREMLFFTLYHQRHHIAVVERRRNN
jgi:hypothetical protein